MLICVLFFLGNTSDKWVHLKFGVNIFTCQSKKQPILFLFLFAHIQMTNSSDIQ